MAKGKLKLELVQNYISLCRLDAEFTHLATYSSKPWVNQVAKNASKICRQQINLTKQLIFRLGLMDAAFSLLNAQMQAAVDNRFKNKFNLQDDNAIVNQKLIKLKNIIDSQKLVAKRFKLNYIESAYLGI